MKHRFDDVTEGVGDDRRTDGIELSAEVQAAFLVSSQGKKRFALLTLELRQSIIDDDRFRGLPDELAEVGGIHRGRCLDQFGEVFEECLALVADDSQTAPQRVDMRRCGGTFGENFGDSRSDFGNQASGNDVASLPRSEATMCHQFSFGDDDHRCDRIIEQ
jgi:hypothetical protein